MSYLIGSESLVESPEADRILLLEPCFPPWVHDVFATPVLWQDAGALRVAQTRNLSLISATIPEAVAMSSGHLTSEVARAYRLLLDWLRDAGASPVRFWNYIPSIGASMGHGLDRYMVFNAGRYSAFERGLATAAGAPFAGATASASAVGVGGRDLVIHCLASDVMGVPVENPRQIPSWRYSRRFGPMPPVFARAVIAALGGRRLLLIAGTASVVGEQSMHPGDPSEQLEETLRNLAAMLSASGFDGDEPFARLGDLRAYVTDDDVARLVRRRLAGLCAPRARIDVRVAEVCRPELLLEIEGVAQI